MERHFCRLIRCGPVVDMDNFTLLAQHEHHMARRHIGQRGPGLWRDRREMRDLCAQTCGFNRLRHGLGRRFITLDTCKAFNEI